MRNIWILVGGVVVVVLILGGVYVTTRPGGPSPVAPAQAQATPPAANPPATAVPAGLQPVEKDHILGSADAPITIVEYASMTCSHCAAFHNEVLPQLKTKYIDTGKVRLIYRDFPLDRIAAQAAQLAECVDRDRYFGVVATIFQTQSNWAAGKEPLADLQKLLRLAGLGEAQAKACLDDQKGLEAVLAEQQGGVALGVDSTPTLFVNGQRFGGARTVPAFEELFAKYLK
ncbi:MAG: DsbA family protein [Reyranellaceae bacterium]